MYLVLNIYLNLRDLLKFVIGDQMGRHCYNVAILMSVVVKQEIMLK